MISITNLCKRYDKGELVLRDVSLDVRDGEFFTLLGPSGCGKTTLLRCIAGLESAESGKMSIGTRQVFDDDANLWIPPERRNVGMVFQSYAIWPHMTVLDNVSFPAEMRGLSNPKTLALEALKLVALDHLSDRSATQLSGGQQQRVALARAIIGRPDVLLLDEPLSNLDAALREQMRGELRRLQTDLRLTTVLVTHDQTEALSMSDTIAIMDKGSIVECGAPETLYLHPSSNFTAAFLGDSISIPVTGIEVRESGVVLTSAIGDFLLPQGIGRDREPSLFIRSEHIIVHNQPVKGTTVPVVVLDRRFIGSGYEYEVSTEGESPVRFQFKSFGGTGVDAGASIHLEIAHDGICIV